MNEQPTDTQTSNKQASNRQNQQFELCHNFKKSVTNRNSILHLSSNRPYKPIAMDDINNIHALQARLAQETKRRMDAEQKLQVVELQSSSRPGFRGANKTKKAKKPPTTMHLLATS